MKEIIEKKEKDVKVLKKITKHMNFEVAKEKVK
jgi:hypothetical protein